MASSTVVRLIAVPVLSEQPGISPLWVVGNHNYQVI
jgi:hypothetical protein